MAASVVVGLDFGTTYSGFAYAHRNAPDQVFIVENWPALDVAGGRRYCKTQTSLFYAPTGPNGSLELKAWGWPALVEYVDAINAAKRHQTTHKETSTSASQYSGEVACIADVKNGDYDGYFITKFKLFLAPGTPQPRLPSGLTVEKLISDYLKAISKFIMDELRSRYGKHLAKSDVQWCLTVPAIWDDGAKQKMEMYAERAGLVMGSYCTEADASPHPLNIILEPEAASMYAQRQLQNLNWNAGDKFLVVDIGGGTIDLALHERVDHNSFQVLEAARNTGDMGGGTFVDDNFMKFVWEKIKCFKAFCHQDPKTGISLFNWWLEKKCAFDGSTSFEWDIPAKLASAWKRDDASNGIKRSDEEYYEMGINQHELSLIFDTEISKVIHLIREQQQLSTTQVKCILVVGGFSDNRYLRKCIKKSFVDEVICPPNPGSAVCHGAVTLGFEAHLIRSRVCKRTYGIETHMAFRVCDSTALKVVSDGIEWCKDRFCIMVRKNQAVAADFVTSNLFFPIHNDAKTMELPMYSSSSENPEFISEVGCVKEGTYTMDISEGLSLGRMRQVEVTMWFGKSKIEVTARRVNFGIRAPEKLYSVSCFS